MIGRAALAACLSLMGAQGHAAEFNFCWRGANGYTMTGKLAFADSLMTAPVVTEDDLRLFRINGFENGIRIGQWSMQDHRPGDTWHLRFDPRTKTFPTGGRFPGPDAQGWNAGGDVTDCGDQGFGFNSGDYSQDICLMGVWVEHSSVHPASPLVATTGQVTPDCKAFDLSS